MPTTTRRMSSLSRRRRAAPDQQVERALVIAGVERRERLARLGDARAVRARARCGRPGRRRRSCRAPRGRAPARRRCRRGRAGSAPAGPPPAREGSSSTARAATPRLRWHELLGLGGQQRVEERVDALAGLGANELGDDLAVLERLDRRDALDPVLARERMVGVDVELRELDLAVARRNGLLEHRAELAARAAPFGPEVDDYRDRRERSITAVWKVGSVTSICSLMVVACRSERDR